jgi:uncharacterized phage protein (TIGR01671 family)
MRYDAEQAYNGHWQMNDITHFGALLISEKYEVMQFTTMSTKDGTELYEYDVVKHITAGWKGVIQFKDGAYRIRNSFNSWELLSYRAEKLLRIGNIYENPDLLTKDEIVTAK